MHSTLQNIHDTRLISHGSDPKSGDTDRLHVIQTRLHQMGDFHGVTIEQQIHLLRALSTFELGRFLLENRGLNAHWTHQLVSYFSGATSAEAMSDLELQIFEQLPAVLATRERFGIFREQLQTMLRPGLVLASVPCGVMGELLLLDYTQQTDIRLLGVDLDQQALTAALALATERGLANEHLSLDCKDAWALNLKDEIDVLVSNGLNIYETDDTRVKALYGGFYDALKPGGTLVTSFLTPPPALSSESPWNLAEINQQSLVLQQVLFMRIIETKWSAFRTYTQTTAQLEEVGFVEIHFINDRARMFPTVVARKHL